MGGMQKGAALVTGGANRIGAYLVHRLAERGFAVGIHFRSSDKQARRLAEDIGGKGGTAVALQADLNDRHSRGGLIAAAVEALGPLSVLINNASLYDRDDLQGLDESLWDAHMSVHVEAPIFLARDFARQLPDEITGSIINLVDARVLTPAPAFFSYGLSKAALWQATTTMAQALAPRIRVNAIGPGATLPDPGQSEEDFARKAKNLPLGRAANPSAVGDAMMYLLGAEAVTGQFIAVDGGKHIAWPEGRGAAPPEE